MTLRAAIIGCGRIAGGYDRNPQATWAFTHAGAYRLSTRVSLVAAADPAETVLNDFGAKWNVTALYADYRDMLQREHPDVVSICSPPETHAAALEAACAAGAKAVWLEKPVAAGVDDAHRAMKAAGSIPVAVNYFRRWNPTFAALKGDMAAGRHGALRRVTVHTVKGVVGNGSHFIDFLRWLLGEPTSTRSFREYRRDDGDSGRDFEMMFSGEVVATFLHVPAPYVLHEVDLFFDRRRITIGQRGQHIQVSDAVEEPHYGGFEIVQAGPPVETEWRRAAPSALDDLLDCIGTDRQPACSLADGVRTLEIANSLEGS